MFDLNSYALPTIFAAGLVVVLAAGALGYALGEAARRHGGGDVSTLSSAMLGLLALLIGFTFAMSLARFDSRREAVLAEANSIGTTALRARLLPQPERTEILNLLRKYVKIRLGVTQRVVTEAELDRAIRTSNAIQEALWQQAQSVAAKNSALVPTGIFLQSLNEMIDDQQKRLTAARNRVPNVVLLALWGFAAVSEAFAGYASGLESRRNRLPIFVIGFMVSLVILLIMDLDRPTAGFVEVSQQPMIDTADSVATYR